MSVMKTVQEWSFLFLTASRTILESHRLPSNRSLIFVFIEALRRATVLLVRIACTYLIQVY